ncbi:MAG: hypothetical protein RLZZ452_1364 [Pseudomonadota bacterium]|jgi:hypothetical protein
MKTPKDSFHEKKLRKKVLKKQEKWLGYQMDTLVMARRYAYLMANFEANLLYLLQGKEGEDVDTLIDERIRFGDFYKEVKGSNDETE